MFVVRIDRHEEEPDYKAFEKRGDAERRFRAASVHVWDNALPSAAWFSVDTSDIRAAIEAVKRGDAKQATLLGFEPKRIDVSLEELGL